MPGPTVLIEIYCRAVASSSVEVDITSKDSPLRDNALLNTLTTKTVGIPVELEIREWLTEWWQP